jgi:hypothetical protein
MRDTDSDIESIIKQLSNEDHLPFADDVNPGEIGSKPEVVAPITSDSPYGAQLNPLFGKGPDRPVAGGLDANPKPTISPVEAVTFDLELIREAWSRYKATTGRDAVYIYLSAIYRTVIVWRKLKRLDRNCILALRSQAISIGMKMEPFAVLIFCTSDPQKVDAKTRSKWSRALRVLANQKPNGMNLKKYIKSCGGVNDCAALFDRKRM